MMIEFIKEAKDSLSKMNNISKYLIKYGLFTVLLIYITAIATYIWGIYSGNLYEMSQYSEQFLTWGTKVLALSLIPALIIDILVKAKDIP